MSQIVLDSAHLLRLAQLLTSARGSISGETGERIARAAHWLEDQVRQQETTPEPEPDTDDELKALVNSLREEWSLLPIFSPKESWTFGNIKESLAKLKAEDWEIMRDYLSYVPRQGERLFQVQNREWFLNAPQNTLTAAKQWGRTHRQPKVIPMREPESYEPEADPEVKAMIHEVLGHLFSPTPEKPTKPAPPKLRYDSTGQTSFID